MTDEEARQLKPGDRVQIMDVGQFPLSPGTGVIAPGRVYVVSRIDEIAFGPNGLGVITVACNLQVISRGWKRNGMSSLRLPPPWLLKL